ncbi:MAG: hypothetical protein ACJAXJ_001751 [Colwellia sp.]|jgi:hypothetical protein
MHKKNKMSFHHIPFKKMFKRVNCFFIIGLFSVTAISATAATVKGGVNGILVSALPSNTHSVKLNGVNGLNLTDDHGSFSHDDGFVDGQYSYQILASVTLSQGIDHTKSLNNGRDPSAKPAKEGVKIINSGNFRIINGLVVTAKAKENSLLRAKK